MRSEVAFSVAGIELFERPVRLRLPFRFGAATVSEAPQAIEDVDLDDLNPESLWKFRVKGFGPLLVSMDSHGGSLYTQVNDAARAKRAAALASMGVRS